MSHRKVALACVLTLLSTAALQADVDKGQKLYGKLCKECHGNGTKGAAMKTQSEWEDLFADEGAEIVEKHEGTGGKGFFTSPKFLKYAPHLKDFLFKYGSDSGNVPAC